MGKNNKPILSVLVDADKKEQFADLARAHKQSMGWLLNDCIDRMLAANSIDIYSNSVGNIENVLKSDKAGITALDVEEIVKTYVSNHSDKNSIGMTREYIESIIKSYVDTDKLNDVVSARINEAIDKQVRPLIERSVADELLKVSSDVIVLEELVKVNIAPIAGRLTELEKQFADLNKPSDEVQAIITKFEKEPELRARVASGLKQGFVGTALNDWLVDGGFVNAKGGNHAAARLSKFKAAIEWMENQDK
jgi:hypothetical protein